MAKKISSEDKINDSTLHELLLMIDAKLNHLEDISADNRAIIIKLVKQGNQVVEFLKKLEVDIDEEYNIETPHSFSDTISINDKKLAEIQKIFDEFNSKKEDLKEFEKELKKHKDKLTPGQLGEP